MKKFIFALCLFPSLACAEQAMPASDRIALQIGKLIIQIETMADQITAKDLEIAKLKQGAGPSDAAKKGN